MIDEPLRLTLTLENGEGTLDFLSRLAARNGVGTMGKFCKDQGLTPWRIRDGCPTELARLGRLAGVPVPDLEAACLRKVTGGFMLHGHPMVGSSLRRHRFLVCPACLQEDIEISDLRPHAAAYGRLAWKVVSIRTCPTHGLGLADIGLGRIPNDQDFAAAIRPHLQRLDVLSDECARRPASELERYVQRRIDGQAGTAPFLDGLELHAAARFCEVIGAFSLHGRGLCMDALGEHDWYLCGAAGIGIAGDGEADIRSFLTGLQRAYPFGHRVKDGPRPPFADFRLWLNSRNRVAYGPARDLLARYVAETPPDVVQDKPRIPRAKPKVPPPVFGMPRKILVTPVRPRRIEQIASFVETRPFTMNAGHAATSHPPSETARPPMLTSSAAAAWLGCEASLFISLQAHGLVTPTYGDWDWRHAFERGPLDDLLTRLLAEVEAVDDIADAVSIMEAANQCSCAPVEIVHLLLAGEISWKGRRATGNDIASLLIRTDAIRVSMEKQGLPGPTLREATVETGVKPKALASLIATGAMTTGTAVDALTGSPVTVIHQASLKQFFENHVELDDLASEVGKDASDVTKCLNMNGVVPIYNDRNLRLCYYGYIDICIHFDKLKTNHNGFRKHDWIINWGKF
ncbi:TniQ family protein [Methylobacterium sp. E-041]|uniref:TniQ family protein n=1 Tax=Methylobacterium sp. E-041 TaxID=2836573 RepID=UPI001FB98234|nr:TniQ family protein [Methylobacterium sp. E-041]MCJ2107301.1 TniQ family protein [Methylobacterium sp. E-041]